MAGANLLNLLFEDLINKYLVNKDKNNGQTNVNNRRTDRHILYREAYTQTHKQKNRKNNRQTAKFLTHSHLGTKILGSVVKRTVKLSYNEHASDRPNLFVITGIPYNGVG